MREIGQLQTERDPRSEKGRYQVLVTTPATHPCGVTAQAVGCNRIRAEYGRSAVTTHWDLYL